MPNMMRVFNRFPMLLLRSPFHRLVSGQMLLISFTGRKSGRRYTTPIVYFQDGDSIIMTTDSPWWKNLQGGTPVILRLRGENVPGVAEAVTDETAVADAVARLVAHYPPYARRAHMPLDAAGRPDPTGRVLIRARVDET